MREFVYDVFARKERGEPLAHIGYVDALDDETARVYAWKTYDEQNWFEMCVVPRSAIRDGRVLVVGAESRLQHRAVSAVRVFGDLAVVGQGLAAGDMVVLDDLSPAVDGRLLAPVPDAEAAERLRSRAAGDIR